MLIFEQIRVGGDRNFAYLIGDSEAKEAVIVDPAFDPGRVVERAEAQKLRVTHIINTHGHGDHTNGNDKARKLTGAPLLAYKNAATGPDVKVDHEDTLDVGSLELKFLYTPGHADDHICVVCGVATAGSLSRPSPRSKLPVPQFRVAEQDRAPPGGVATAGSLSRPSPRSKLPIPQFRVAEQDRAPPGGDVAITGDLLFVGKIGGTGSDETAKAEYASLHEVLLKLPDSTTTWPGHDYGCRPSSTIGLEKRTNPFVLCESIDAFLDLKAHWATFKAERGLK